MFSKLDYALLRKHASHQLTSFCLSGMETKLQRRTNLSAIAADETFAANHRMLESQIYEPIKKIVLMHEEIFKQQVNELHRLYNIQKKLMHELKNEVIRRMAPLTVTNNSKFAIWHQPVTHIQHNAHHTFSVRSNDPKEKSGSCSGPESSRMPMKLDLTQEGALSVDLHQFGKDKELESIDEETGDRLAFGPLPANVVAGLFEPAR
ncbi:uncharacterized protein Fot_36107 [Forsythia ovata]|uniref:Uncharacterized protein n=1 Tax=Forsythia ovata TaxID=205694 RepID=A0ABD1SPZ9_9LAMI